MLFSLLYVQCNKEAALKEKTKNLLLNTIAFLNTYSEKAFNVKSKEAALKMMISYKADLQKQIEQKEKLAERFPAIQSEEFPEYVKKNLPQVNREFVEAFQKNLYFLNKVRQKYGSPEYEEENKLAWIDMIKAFSNYN